MANENEFLNDIQEKDIFNMIDDTSQLVFEDISKIISNTTTAQRASESLVNNVEFWQWMNRNYKSGIFSSPQSMKEYINQGVGKSEWFYKQLQGKGYEYDWTIQQRNNLPNLFKKYKLPDNPTQGGIDVTEVNMLTGKQVGVQLKAYTSKANPDLHNTPKDTPVVTNTEKVSVVKNNGYEDVREFQTAQEITQATDKKFQQAQSGKAESQYTFKNVGNAMLKAGAVACVIGMTVESIASYKEWQEGIITKEEYIKEILKTGVSSGANAAATTAIMVPIKAAITTAGYSSIVTVPIAFVVSVGIDKIVAPCLRRGKYAEYKMNIEETTNIQNSLAEFSCFSYQLYETTKELTNTIVNTKLSKTIKNTIHKELDKNLNEILEEI